MSGETLTVFAARLKMRDVAMGLARRGLSAETIRAAMLDMAASEAEEAIAWAEAYDRAQDALDREEFADECAREERKEREAAE